VLARNVGEVLEFLQSLNKSFAIAFFDKSVSTRRFMALFPRKYLSRNIDARTAIGFGESSSTVSIDQLDHHILKHMAADSFASSREISRRLSAPPSTIEKRVLRLKEDKVIAGAVYSTAPREYGSESLVLMIFAKGFDGNLTSALLRFARNHPHCTYFVEAFGAWDYELGVEVENHEQLLRLREEIAARFGEYLNAIKTLTRLKVYKYSSYPIETFE
jgi:DNA-binding Lrp family transcriptional regulator